MLLFVEDPTFHSVVEVNIPVAGQAIQLIALNWPKVRTLPFWVPDTPNLNVHPSSDHLTYFAFVPSTSFTQREAHYFFPALEKFFLHPQNFSSSHTFLFIFFFLGIQCF
jgi:hypothetical protein